MGLWHEDRLCCRYLPFGRHFGWKEDALLEVLEDFDENAILLEVKTATTMIMTSIVANLNRLTRLPRGELK